MSLKIWPYQMASESAKDLATILGVLRIKQEGTYVPKHAHKVLNWGNSSNPSWIDRANARSVTVLNKPSAVNVAANKLTALQTLQRAGVSIPTFTTSTAEAQNWLSQGHTVVERHELRGNSGAGIRIVAWQANEQEREMGVEDNITRAPLYTKYIPKTAEFRVHIFRGEVIDYVQKLKLSTERRPAHFNKYISSTEFGWVFSRNGIRDITEVRQLAIKAVAALGLDFGAVDIVYADGLPYVLEVNTAPGLAGTTLVRYGNALRRFMGLSDLPLSVTQSYMDTNQQPAVLATEQPLFVPQGSRTMARTSDVTSDLITLQMDRTTALKLKSLLASIV